MRTALDQNTAKIGFHGVIPFRAESVRNTWERVKTSSTRHPIVTILPTINYFTQCQDTLGQVDRTFHCPTYSGRNPGSPARKTRNPPGILAESWQDYQDYQESWWSPGRNTRNTRNPGGVLPGLPGLPGIHKDSWYSW